MTPHEERRALPACDGIVYGVADSYITTRLAPDRPMHALALGIAGLAMSIPGAVATWGRGPAFGPAWFPLDPR